MTFLSPIASNTDKVLDYIETYETALEEIKPFFDLKNRKLVEICQNIPKEIARFKRYAAELKSIEELISIKRDEYVGKRWKAYNETNSRTLAAKDIQQYINGEKDFVDYSELILEVTYLRNNINAVIEALDIMNWQVGHITKMAVASIEEYTL